ncbi:MAG TPA: molybdopterin-dependent oxidoreductase, partial [Thermodesulfovibrionia bacterium]|nr:molybdopterin-dependent oxidoreductase [Thermodesulfovibrionia bacterium]
IMCTCCVRMCEDVQGASALAVVGRGSESRVEAFSNERYNCEYCGNCITVCPVGSILSRHHVHSCSPWQITHETDTVCGYCGVGCSMTIQVRDEEISRVYPKVGKGVSRGLLCVRGRFGYEYVNHQERLKTPLIRKNEKLYHCSWEEAYDYVARRLSEIKASFGSQAIAGIASTRCTNESAYIFQKFLRAVIGTNHIDSGARLGFTGALRMLESILGQGITANQIDEVAKGSTIFVMGGDPTVINPILGLQVRAAYRRGAQVFTCGNAAGLKRFTTLEVQAPVYGEEALVERLVLHIYKDKGTNGTNPLLDEWLKEKSDSVKEDKEAAAREAVCYRLVELLYKTGGTAVIILGPDLVQRANGWRNLLWVSALTYLLNAKLYLMSEGPNAQGVTDMGCVPDLLPGYVPVCDELQAKVFEKQWGSRIPGQEGLTLMEIMEASLAGQIKALYVMGENPAFHFPDNPRMINALNKLDLLIVQDNFLTETASFAHVVLPSKTWSELNGTYTNLERRVQFVRRAIKGSGKQDWRIISDIANRMGYKMEYPSSEHVLMEILSVSPLYKGLNRKAIDKGTNLWPYQGKIFSQPAYKLPEEKRRSAAPMEGVIHLRQGSSLFHWDSISQKCPILHTLEPEPVLRVSSATYKEYRFEEGDKVVVTSPVGSMELRVAEDRFLESNTVMLDNSHASRGVFSLMGYTLDTVTKTPGLDGWNVRIKRVTP